MDVIPHKFKRLVLINGVFVLGLLLLSNQDSSVLQDYQNAKKVVTLFYGGDDILINRSIFFLKEKLSIKYTDLDFKTEKVPSTTYFISTRTIITKDKRRVNGYDILSNKSNFQILGDTPNDLWYGCLDFLESLGFMSLLSYDIVESSAKFDGWPKIDVQNDAIAKKRIVLNWHNFLSSCSTWDLIDWKHYILQSSKMKYNHLMVHAYGNNPMIEYSYLEQTKPIGYLTSSIKGRDWGTQHHKNVTKLVGGDVFSDSIFGSEAAKVPDSIRHKSVKALMNEVFEFSHQNGMKNILAVDVDTEAANPQNIITKIPKEALIINEGIYLVNPEHPEGYKFYKERLRKLLEDYPNVDELVIWFRRQKWHDWSWWRSIKRNHFPTRWKQEYDSLSTIYPVLKSNIDSERRDRNFIDGTSLFALSKLINTYDKILRDIGKTNVKLSAGSWHFYYMQALDVLVPKSIEFMGLDSKILLDKEITDIEISKVSKGRKVTPFIWAHHDDRTYLGRPYLPWHRFGDLLKKLNTDHFGIIHWTTRPLDMFFKNSSNQVFKTSLNEDIDTTCEQLANALFSGKDKDFFSNYLIKWHKESPQFGRETSDFLIDESLMKESKNIIESSRNRLIILDKINEESLTQDAQKMLLYFKTFETFVYQFFDAQMKFEESISLQKLGNYKKAQQVLLSAKPKEAILTYIKASKIFPISPGEKGLIISLNTRWLIYFNDLKESLGIEPFRINFGSTHHEPLAQRPGVNTYITDNSSQMWRTFGEHETGSKIMSANVENNPISGEFLIMKPNESFTVKFNYGIRRGKYAIQILAKEKLDKTNLTLKVEDKKVQFQPVVNQENNSITYESTIELASGKSINFNNSENNNSILINAIKMKFISEME